MSSIPEPTARSVTAFPPPTIGERLAWCFFDFANSSFTTVITTVVYARWFLAEVIPGDSYLGLHEDSWWAGAGIFANVAVILTAPLVGAAADRLAAKKRFLLYASAICVVATGALSFMGPGAVLLTWATVVIATIAFASGENLVAGFLPELAPPESMGRLSAYGWTVGYFGGLMALGMAWFMADCSMTQWVPLATAAFFAISSAPTFLFLRERAVPHQTSEGDSVPSQGFKAAFQDLRETWAERHLWRDLATALIAILFFTSGLAVVVAFAAIYAEHEIGMEDGAIIQLFIVLQLAAAAGAFGFGYIQDWWGSKQALSLSILVWLAAVLVAYIAHTETTFMVCGVLAGIAMGGSQSASRALVGLFAPDGREGEWFGLWGFSTKLAAVLGLGFYASLMAVAGDRRLAMLGTLVLFGLGLVFLLKVNVERGMQAAREEAQPPSAPEPQA